MDAEATLRALLPPECALRLSAWGDGCMACVTRDWPDYVLRGWSEAALLPPPVLWECRAASLPQIVNALMEENPSWLKR